MPETLLLEVARGDKCDCDTLDVFCGQYRVGHWNFGREGGGGFIPCPHGSTVTVLPAQVVKCGECLGGVGGVEHHYEDGTPYRDLSERCPTCLGTGRRLAPRGEG